MTADPLQSDLPDLRGLTLLLVDDDAETTRVLTTYLRACGATVITAHTAMEALASVDAAPLLDAVVTDLWMPGMDGVEFLRRVRGHSSRRRNVPVLVVTGLGTENMPVEQFDAHLRKPVDLDELCRTIEAIVARRRSAIADSG